MSNEQIDPAIEIAYLQKMLEESIEERKRLSEENRDIRAMRSAAHNFYVTVKPWLHHESSMLKATIADLKHELAKGEKDGVYLY